jgi:hypothetical protein
MSDSRELAALIRTKLRAYLNDQGSGAEVAAWAATMLAKHSFDSSETLLDEALCALADVGHADETLDTPYEDLARLQAALSGEGEYTVNLRWP